MASQIINFLKRSVAYVSDTDDIKVKKALLTFISILLVMAGFCWAALYYFLGYKITAVIPLIFSLVLSLVFFNYLIFKKYRPFLYAQLFLILVLPFAVQLTLGGFNNSGAVFLWSILAPVGAFMFHTSRSAFVYFLMYLLLLGVLTFFNNQQFIETKQPDSQDIQIFFAMNIGVLSSIIFTVLWHFVNALKDEHERSELLLLNILPASIAKELKINPDIHIANEHPAVTILFADIVGFTEMSNKLSADVLVQTLNKVFLMFDDLVHKHNLEKIKTIGDAIMVVGGLPDEREDHAECIANLALDLQHGIKALKTPDGEPLSLRIGIHSGPVVAGVIGSKKFSYDTWGDTVNTAARMEATSIPNYIQTTQDTYELIKEKFSFSNRGVIDVKGKGKLNTFFLEKRI